VIIPEDCEPARKRGGRTVGFRPRLSEDGMRVPPGRLLYGLPTFVVTWAPHSGQRSGVARRSYPHAAQWPALCAEAEARRMKYPVRTAVHKTKGQQGKESTDRREVTMSGGVGSESQPNPKNRRTTSQPWSYSLAGKSWKAYSHLAVPPRSQTSWIRRTRPERNSI
jgi:hypothetical protein